MPKTIFDRHPVPGTLGAIISLPIVIPVTLLSGIGTLGVSAWSTRKAILFESAFTKSIHRP
jgi:hypothetical protein